MGIGFSSKGLNDLYEFMKASCEGLIYYMKRKDCVTRDKNMKKIWISIKENAKLHDINEKRKGL